MLVDGLSELELLGLDDPVLELEDVIDSEEVDVPVDVIEDVIVEVIVSV